MKTLTQYQLEESILFIDEQSFASYIQSNYPKLLFTFFSTSIKDYTSTNQFDVSETTNHQLLAELTNTLPQYIDNYFLDTLFDTFNHEHDKAFNRLQKPSIALGGQSPRSLLGQPNGKDIVLNELGRINNGVFA